MKEKQTIRQRSVRVLLILVLSVRAAVFPAYAGQEDGKADTFGYKLGSAEVRMLAGRSGKVEDGNGRTVSRWALDEEGYFTISVEKPGEYSFRFTELNERSRDSTFGVTVVGAGGGGGGARIDPDEDDHISETREKQHDGVGSGGSGGEVRQIRWNENGEGLRIADHLDPVTVTVGMGGEGGRAFYYCKCGGSACPIGLRSTCPWCSDNDGKDGGASRFGAVEAAGGKGGRAGENTEGRYSAAQASSGEYGNGAGAYLFWGAVCRCGSPGAGGSFGENNGSAGNPYIFHFGYNSFGHSGITPGGHGNGGGGGGMSYAYGHPMVTGTGTGTGRGSYSPTVRGTAAGGGDDDSVNGYVLIEGKVRFSDSEDGYERLQLKANILPVTADPLPQLVWSSSNASVAKVSQTGSVILKSPGSAVITATAPNGVQGVYFIDHDPAGAEVSGTAIDLFMEGTIRNAGDTAQMHAVVLPRSDTAVFWNSTNPSVAFVDTAGKVTAKSSGTAVITAGTADHAQAGYAVTVGTGVSGRYPVSSFLNLTADRTDVRIGETAHLELTSYPSADFAGEWQISSPDKVSFDPETRTVTFLGEGIVTLTARSFHGGSSSWTFRITGDREENKN